MIELLSNHIVKSAEYKEERRNRYLFLLKYLFCYAKFFNYLQDLPTRSAAAFIHKLHIIPIYTLHNKCKSRENS